MNGGLSLWVEIPVALLLVASGIFTLSAAIGVLRLKTFVQRMHPPALAYSFSAWCLSLANILYFSAQGGGLVLHAWLIIVFLSMTVPVTTLLLARTELFRKRTDPHTATEVPPPLSRLVPPPGLGAAKDVEG